MGSGGSVGEVGASVVDPCSVDSIPAVVAFAVAVVVVVLFGVVTTAVVVVLDVDNSGGSVVWELTVTARIPRT